MKDPTAYFSFTAMPKCMTAERPNSYELKKAEEANSILFVIYNGDAPVTPAQVDMFIDGYLAGCEVKRSPHMAIFFNDTNLSASDARLKFIEKYKNLKFPATIDGYTTIATGKKGNLISSFLGIPSKKGTGNGTAS